MPFAEPGFSRGYANASNARTARKNVANEAEALKQARVKQAADSMKAAIDKSEASSVAMFDKYIGLISEASQSATPNAEQLNKFAQAAVQPLQMHALLLGQIRAQAAAAGATEEQLALLPDPQRFIGDRIPMLELTINNAMQKTPEATAARDAAAKMTEAQELATRLGVPIEQVAQAMNILPTPPSPMQGIDESGQPVFARPGADGTMQPMGGVRPMPNKGFTIETDPDGGTRITMGDGGGPQTPTKVRLEKSIIDSQSGLARLFEVQNSFDPRFLTYPGKFENWSLAKMEKINPNLLSDADREFLSEYSTFTTNAVDNMNRYISEMTGAQMSVYEADRIRKGIPDPENDSPTQFQSRLATNTRQLALARARAIHALREGVDGDPWDEYSLDQMQGIINKRADELTAEFAAKQGTTADQARSQALDIVRREFGL